MNAEHRPAGGRPFPGLESAHLERPAGLDRARLCLQREQSKGGGRHGSLPHRRTVRAALTVFAAAQGTILPLGILASTAGASRRIDPGPAIAAAHQIKEVKPVLDWSSQGPSGFRGQEHAAGDDFFPSFPAVRGIRLGLNWDRREADQSPFARASGSPSARDLGGSRGRLENAPLRCLTRRLLPGRGGDCSKRPLSACR